MEGKEREIPSDKVAASVAALGMTTFAVGSDWVVLYVKGFEKKEKVKQTATPKRAFQYSKTAPV